MVHRALLADLVTIIGTQDLVFVKSIDSKQLTISVYKQIILESI